jgi:hypothetical protein
MATNKPHGDDARKGPVRDRSHLKIEGEEHWTKRDTTSGQFKDQRKKTEDPPYKDIRRYPEPTD